MCCVVFVLLEVVGLGLMVFVVIEVVDYSFVWCDNFFEIIGVMLEVMEIYWMVGEIDYMLKVVVVDMVFFDVFYCCLMEVVVLKNVILYFVMEWIKIIIVYLVDIVYC